MARYDEVLRNRRSDLPRSKAPSMPPLGPEGCVNLQLYAHFSNCAFAADVKPIFTGGPSSIPHERAPRNRVTYFVT